MNTPSPTTQLTPPSPRHRRGFTLIEAIATIVVLGTLGSVVSSLIFRSVESYTTISTAAQVQSDLSAAMDRIDRELREIDGRGGGTVAPNITSVSASSITFVAGGVTKTLALSGTTLNFTDTSGTTALLDNVTTFGVAAFDQSNTALAASLSGSACDAVRRLSVTMAVTRNGATDTLRTRVFIRNTMAGAG